MKAPFVGAALFFAFLSGSAEASPATTATPWLPSSERTSVISMAGLEAALCALKPAMSQQAVSEISASLAFACESVPKYISVATWVSIWWPVSENVQAQLRSKAQLFRGFPPFNGSIATWLADRGARPVAASGPIELASVSALSYTSKWLFPNVISERRLFRGRHTARTVPFVGNIHAATLEEYPDCERAIVQLREGNVILAMLPQRGNVTTCLARPIMPYRRANSAVVALPEVHFQETSSLEHVMKMHGIRTMFDRSKNPLPGLLNDAPIPDVQQSVKLTIDRFGVGVMATTLIDIALTGGLRESHKVIVDRPFVIRVLDAKGNIVADAAILDV